MEKLLLGLLFLGVVGLAGWLMARDKAPFSPQDEEDDAWR